MVRKAYKEGYLDDIDEGPSTTPEETPSKPEGQVLVFLSGLPFSADRLVRLSAAVSGAGYSDPVYVANRFGRNLSRTLRELAKGAIGASDEEADQVLTAFQREYLRRVGGEAIH